MNVSIVNWIKNPASPPEDFVLDGVRVDAVTSALRSAAVDVSAAARLPENRGYAFQGPIPAGEGFVLSKEEAEELLGGSDAEYSQVVRPYLIGDDIVEDPSQGPRRWIIDFGFMPLEEASRYPAVLALVKERVKPFRDKNRDRGFRENWWRFGRPRRDMREALTGLQRYIASNRIGKRILFTWQGPEVCPSDLAVVFALDDDFAMGVLCSRVHGDWVRAQSSTLRVDIRYTPTSAFETFPWPMPSNDQRKEIAGIAKALIGRRQAICAERGIGLTPLYNEVDEGAYRDLRDLHRDLDRAVAVAYGWPASAAEDSVESNRRLLELNKQIAAGEVEYDPFGYRESEKAKTRLEAGA